jgi:hypothetical protein
MGGAKLEAVTYGNGATRQGSGHRTQRNGASGVRRLGYFPCIQIGIVANEHAAIAEREAVAGAQQRALTHGARIDIDTAGIGEDIEHETATIAVDADVPCRDLAFGNDEVVVVGATDREGGPRPVEITASRADEFDAHGGTGTLTKRL